MKHTRLRGLSKDKYVFLPQNVIEGQLNAYRIKERHYGIGRLANNLQYMITCGLSSCFSLIIYSNKTALMAHIAVGPFEQEHADTIVEFLFRRLPNEISISDAEVTIVWGGWTKGQEKGRGKGDIKAMKKLIARIKQYPIKSFKIDSSFGIGMTVRGVYIDLKTGEVVELRDKDIRWCWDKKHDTSINIEIPHTMEELKQ